MKISILVGFAAATVNSWVINYYLGPSCQGEELGTQTIDDSPGACISTSVIDSESALVIADGITDTSLVFYTGTNCEGEILGLQSNAGCVVFTTDGFGSIQVAT